MLRANDVASDMGGLILTYDEMLQNRIVCGNMVLQMQTKAETVHELHRAGDPTCWLCRIGVLAVHCSASQSVGSSQSGRSCSFVMTRAGLGEYLLSQSHGHSCAYGHGDGDGDGSDSAYAIISAFNLQCPLADT